MNYDREYRGSVNPKMRLIKRSLLLCLLTAVLANPLAAADVGFDLFGVSYHLDRRTASGERFHEFNPGLGIQFIPFERAQGLIFLEGGFYRDSFANTAKFMSFGGKYKIIEPLSLGVGITVCQSPSFNRGHPVLAPIPFLTYRYKRVSLTMVYLPESENINDYASLAFYATVWPFSGKDAPAAAAEGP